MTEHTRFRGHRAVLSVLKTTAGLVFGGALLHWSWNTVAADLFQAPLMEFRHGLAAEIFIIVIAVTGAMSIRLMRRSDSDHKTRAG
jgi:hypothetical protein